MGLQGSLFGTQPAAAEEQRHCGLVRKAHRGSVPLDHLGDLEMFRNDLWRSFSVGWRDLLRVVALRNLSPDQTRALLQVEGVSIDLLDQVMALTHGHPLPCPY